MTLEEMREIALSFPGCTEGSSYGQPSFLVNKKFFTRLRREDDSLVLFAINRHQDQDVRIEFDLRPFPDLVVADHQRLGGSALNEANVERDPLRVVPELVKDSVLGEGQLSAVLPPVSWTMIRLSPRSD